MVAAAAIGGAVVSGVASNASASSASDSSRRSARYSANAQVRSTELQIEEMRRQFDYQQQVLEPAIQRQYEAQGAYSDLLGIGTQPPSAEGQGGAQQASTLPANAMQGGQQPGDQQPTTLPGGGAGAGGQRPYRGAPQGNAFQPVQQGQQPGQGGGEVSTLPASAGNAMQGGQQPAVPGEGGAALPETQPTQFQRGERGQFVDPNLDPTRLAETSEFRQHVEDTQLAPDDPGEDPFRNYISDNQVAAPSLEEDQRFQRARDVTAAEGAAGQSVYGEEFEESPGYEFQREEMNRALDRRNSAGGNYGGRAVMEAQRRAQGLAQQDFHNWAQGRSREIDRLAAAEQYDISRGDQAVSQYEQDQLIDTQRGDQAMQDYMRRREGDVTREDAAVQEEDRLRGVDLQRGDQGYYNYLANVGASAGFGNPAGQAVSAAGQQGQQVANAYAQRGNALSSINMQNAQTQANITANNYANINNSMQQGMQNYLTYQMLQG